MDAKGEDDGEDRYGNGESIDGVRAAEKGVGDSSEGWAGDGCDLKCAGIPGDSVGEVFFGDQMRQDGSAYGKAETPADADKSKNGVDQVNRLRSTPTDGEQQSRAQAVSRVARHQQFAAIKEIGGVSGEEKECEAGGKLGQPDVSEIERTLGDFVDLPSHGHGLHLQRYDDEEARDSVGDKVGMGEGDTAGQARVFLGEHS